MGKTYNLRLRPGFEADGRNRAGIRVPAGNAGIDVELTDEQLEQINNDPEIIVSKGGRAAELQKQAEKDAEQLNENAEENSVRTDDEDPDQAVTDRGEPTPETTGGAKAEGAKAAAAEQNNEIVDRNAREAAGEERGDEAAVRSTGNNEPSKSEQRRQAEQKRSSR